jgi:hemolysin III
MRRFREPVNGFTHLAGAIFAVVGLVWMLAITQDNAAKMVTVVIYGITMILLYSASAAYHLSKGSERKILRLRSLDHAAIYLLIAGTYTPVFYSLLSGRSRLWMLIIVWGLALLGAIYKLFFLRDPGYLSLLCYVILGSAGVIALPQAITRFPPGTGIYVLTGGVLYIIGVIVYGMRKPNFNRHFGHHEIWHLLVLGGNALHFIAIARVLNG